MSSPLRSARSASGSPGGRHVLIWETGAGEVRQLETRLAGNVLIWTEGGRTFRLEGGLDRGQMLELGRQITR